jgi:hypothetical protein
MTDESRQVRRARERAEAKANRKVDVKAKATIEPFFLMTKEFNEQGLPVFNKKELEANQLNFVEGIEKGFAKTKQSKPEADFNFASMYWGRKDDFAGTMIEAKDVDEAEREFQKLWDKSQSVPSATTDYPQIGQEWTREQLIAKGGDTAGMSMDLLKEGGQWPWPNAKAIFTKKGDKMVVTETL